MLKGDFIYIGILLVFGSLIFLNHEEFSVLTKTYPYASGFVKFAILASMGELLVIRFANNKYQKMKAFYLKVFLWGIIGVMITLMFNIYASGVKFALAKGLLKYDFMFAFYVSVIMNFTFGVAFMAFHRFTDAYIDARVEKKIKASEIILSIEWGSFINFVVLKTIPFFWVPVHTITFLLPEVYRVLVAAILSIVLGIILSFAKLKK